ncbi:phasin family protein [Bauldia sp.]|uniref:phasin family protein n=1 Tax=Bauldia sp. TaxID=2575872 RepID=UPI003BABD918
MMMNPFENFQKFGQDNVDIAVESADAVSKGFQALATEAADYSKTAFEASASAATKMLAAGSLDKAMEVQAEFVRSAYEGYVGQATKVGEIVSGMAKDAYKPYETFFSRVNG